LNKIPHVYVCAVLSNFLMFHWKLLTRTRNENVDVWMRKKVFLRERMWAFESECFETCLSLKKSFYRVKTCSSTRRSMYFFIYVYLSRRKIQNHWSVSICSFFVQLSNNVVRPEKSMYIFIFYRYTNYKQKNLFIFSNYTLITLLDMQNDCKQQSIMMVI
jgi:hypothetical protein